ncbi:hypothetical protein C8Q80DRAFT_1266076 [Daedaleopsis nitida]|nr:hypothetical protein C8Q80DRAFT_1266076 [Daedaleopsis nitida]
MPTIANSQFFPSSHPHVPPELQLMVIDELRGDSNTLSACSLVSKTWLSPSRAHLFRTISLTARKDTSEQFTDFLHFLQKLPKLVLGSDIPQYVEELAFYGEPIEPDGLEPPEEDWHADCDDPDHMTECHVPLCISTVFAYVRILPRLNTLDFYHVLLRDGPLPAFSSVSSEARMSTQNAQSANFGASPAPSVPTHDSGVKEYSVTLPELRCLRFIDCSAPRYDLRILLVVVSLFSSIGQLSIVDGTWETVLEMDYVLAQTFPTGRLPPVNWLRLIDASADWPEALEVGLRKQAAQGTPLRILDVKAHYNLSYFFSDDLPALTSHHLVQLTVYMFDHVCTHPESFPLPWDLVLPNLPSLTTLQLDLHCQLITGVITKEQRPQHMRNAIRVYSSLLASSTSLDRLPLLSTVTFDIHDAVIAYRVLREGARESCVWKDFGDALVALPSLAVVQFILIDSDESVGPDEEMRQHVDGFVEKFIPQLIDDPQRPAGEGSNGRRYRVMFDDDRVTSTTNP